MAAQVYSSEEKISREELEELQLKRLKKAVKFALKTPFYQERLNKAGIKSKDDITSLKDIEKIPYTTKDDLRDAFPYGMLAVDKSDLVRLHASSGTTGTPTVIYFNQHDIDSWAQLTARSLFAVGGRKEDVFQNMMTYGLFTGGLGLHYGAEKLGSLVIPASGGNTKRQIKMFSDYGTTIVHATPSYLLHLFTVIKESGIKLSELSLKKAVVGAEPHSEEIRQKIETLFGIDVYNSYGLSEMNGPGVGFECEEKNELHIWEDSYLMEIIDPESGKVLGEGEDGELVFSILDREATPILRYRTRDLSRILPANCPCGRTSRRIARIKGRSDDMLIINGVNVFPSQIEDVIMKMPQIGTNYQIVIRKQGALDSLIVKSEVSAKNFTDDIKSLEKLRRGIAENLKASISINPKVELHEPGFLPVSEGKAKRVFDER